MNDFKRFYCRFSALAKKLSVRDKQLEKFKHYYDKILKLRVARDSGALNPKELEKVQRNERKYEQSLIEFETQNQ